MSIVLASHYQVDFINFQNIYDKWRTTEMAILHFQFEYLKSMKVNNNIHWRNRKNLIQIVS